MKKIYSSKRITIANATKPKIMVSMRSNTIIETKETTSNNKIKEDIKRVIIPILIRKLDNI